MQIKHASRNYCKRLLAAIMVMALVVGSIAFTGIRAYANPSTRVTILGHYVDFEGTQPIFESNRVLVPVRGVFTLMGFTPEWHQATQTATLRDGANLVIIPIGQPHFTVNGRVITPDVPARNVGGRIVIPLRAVAEAVGGAAHWEPNTRTAIIIPPYEMIARTQANIAAVTGVHPGTPAITTSALPTARVGEAYNQTLHATGNTPITWAIASGALPAGLSLNTNTGAITGTPTTQGTSNFTVHAQNAAGTTTRSLSINVEAALGFTVTFNANGGTGTMQSQVFTAGVAQNLRANTFTRTGYTFSGWRSTPTGAAQYSNSQSLTVNTNRTLYAVWVSGYTITFQPNATGVTGTMAPQVFQRNVAQNLRANTFARPGFAFAGWSTTPTGTVQFTDTQNITNHLVRNLYAVWTTGYVVTFQPNATGVTGTMLPQTFQRNVAQNLRTNTFARPGFVFAGWATTPTGAVQFTDAQNITNHLVRNLYAVWATGTAPVIPTSPTPPPANIGVHYHHQLVVTPTTVTPVTWSLEWGSLPAGLHLSAAGVISGTPTATATTQTFYVRATNSVGHGTRQFTITIGGAPVITTPSGNLAGGTVGVPTYHAQLTATNSPTSWSVVSATGTFPPGLTLNANGTITGTPTTAGTFTFSVQAWNPTGWSAPVQFTITISPSAAPVIDPPGIVLATTNTPATTRQLTATIAPTSWSIISPPTWVTIDNNGLITIAFPPAGIHVITVQAHNATGASVPMSVQIDVS